jgi:hypothetical protein
MPNIPEPVCRDFALEPSFSPTAAIRIAVEAYVSLYS